jgi:hypothetical protein
MSFGGKTKPMDETEEARALAEVAAKRFNRYQEIFVPLENQYINEVMATRDQPAYEMAGALSAAPYAREFAGANEQFNRGIFGQGVDVSSGAFESNSAALRRAAAVKQGMGVAAGKVANTDRFYGGLKGLIAMGQGQGAEAMAGLGSLADTANKNAAANIEASFKRASSNRALAGTAAGLMGAPFVDQKLQSQSAMGGG